MMTAAVAALAVVATSLLPATRLVPSGIDLQYRRPLGQVAQYHLLLRVEGSQVSLGERRPVRVRAEVEFAEEVIAHERGGGLWLRVRTRPLKVEDPSGTFSRGREGEWPEVRVRMTPRGEVLDVSLAAGDRQAGAAERSFAALMSQPAPVILPPNRVEVGAEWVWERDGAVQRSRLLEIIGEGEEQVARIVSEGHSRLRLEEGSEALGLMTLLSGEVTQHSQLDLLSDRGMPARHKGEMRVQTNSQVTLNLPEGPEAFEMLSDLRIEFDLRLVSVDGEPVSFH